MSEQKDARSGLRSRIENFWYYHKWAVLIGGLCLIAVVYLTVGTLTARKGDVFGVVVTTSELSEVEKVDFCKKVGEAVGDRNGDGDAWALLQFIVLADLAGGEVRDSAYNVLLAALASDRYEVFFLADDVIATARFDGYFVADLSNEVRMFGPYAPVRADALKAEARYKLSLCAHRMETDAQYTAARDCARALCERKTP